ncbi:MAG: tetratricopeptide repeat protein [Candidatus Acidiferrales bacterium]|jgi:tetratricopeptide (TPR) repeat protein
MLHWMLKLALLIAVCGAPAWSIQQGQDPQQQKPQPQADQSNPPQPPPLGPGESSSAKPQQTGDPTAPQPEPTPEKPATTPTSGAKPAPSNAAKPGVLPPEDNPAWDPFHAAQDIDVGTFYMHKGDMDAAIGRFQDAIRLRPNFAKPRLLIAEIYEKKGDKSEAVHYYKEYLQVFPDAPDSAKVKKKIEKLSKE